jgi:hypothetical protein
LIPLQPDASPAEPATPPAEEDSRPLAAEANQTVATEDSKVVVFSSQGQAGLEASVLRHEECLCGARVPVRVDDVGGTVYCPHCSAEIQVGATLEQDRSQAARAAPTPSVPVREARFRLLRSPVSLAALLLVAAAGSLGWYFTWRHPATVRGLVGDWLPGERPPSTKEAPKPSSPPAHDDAAKPDKPPPVRPDASISLQAIENLLCQSDAAAALVQAQIWLETLRECRVPPGDARLARLAEVIRVLEPRVASPVALGPPPVVAEFRNCVQSLADAIKANDPAKAKQHLAEAEEFLAAYPKELGPYSARFLALKAKLRQEEGIHQGIGQIRQWLGAVPGRLDADRTTEALEFLARAKFFALQTPLTEAEFKEFDTKVRDLGPLIRFARGRRAVKDAKNAHQAGDVALRDREARRALSWLPGLPESQIAPYVNEVQPWLETKRDNRDSGRPRKGSPGRSADAEPSRAVPAPTSSAARQIDVREQYEFLLEAYGEGRTSDVVPAAVELERLLRGDTGSAKMYDRIGTMLFDVLEPEIVKLLAESEGKRADAERFDKLTEIRRSLARLEPWKQAPRFIAMDELVRSQGGELARKLVDKAQQAAAADDLAGALRLLANAADLAAADTSARVARLRTEWEGELKLRADKQAERDAWHRIEGLRKQPEEELTLYEQLVRYIRRFPHGAHADEVRHLGGKMRAVVETRLAAKLVAVAALIDSQQWSEFRRQLEVLRTLNLPASLQPELERLLARLPELKTRADAEFLLLKRHSRLIRQADVLAVLEKTPEILALDPDHADATELLAAARRRGATYAEQLLKSAASFKATNPELWRSKLQRATQLDPDGPHGAKAKELLQSE